MAKAQSKPYMLSKSTLIWCGPCWIENGRRVAIAKLRKLPLCSDCLADFIGHDEQADEIFRVWDAMPDMDEREESANHFSNFVKIACRTRLDYKPKQITEEDRSWQQARKTLKRVQKWLRDNERSPWQSPKQA